MGVNTQIGTPLVAGAAPAPNSQAQIKSRLKAQFEATAKCAQITTGMCAAAGTVNTTPPGGSRSSGMFSDMITTGKKRPSIIDTVCTNEGERTFNSLGSAKKPRTTHASDSGTSVDGKPQVWSPLRRLSWLAADATPALKQQCGGERMDASDRPVSEALEHTCSKAGSAARGAPNKIANDDPQKSADDTGLDTNTCHDGSTTPPPVSPLLQLDVRPDRRRRHVRTSSNSSILSTSSVHSVQGEGLDENGRGIRDSAESTQDRFDEKRHSLLSLTMHPNPVYT